MGTLTSASHSFRLKKNIGYAWVPIALADPGNEIEFESPDGPLPGVTAELAVHRSQEGPAEELTAGPEPASPPGRLWYRLRAGSIPGGSAMRAIRTALVVTLVLGLLGALAVPASSDTAVPKVGNGHRTVVSLQWDDGSVHQIALLRMLRRYRMHATFYVNSARLGTRGFMSWDDVHALARAGNEIAGHTLTHKHLPRLPHWKQVKQICGDRMNLFEHGFHPSSFAYPYGSLDKRVEKVVRHCGYNTGRGVYGLDSSGCDTAPPCPFAETILRRTPGSPARPRRP